MMLRIEKIANGYLIIYDIGNGVKKVFRYTFEEALEKSMIITESIGGEMKNAL